MRARSRGLALLLVAGILGILGALAVGFTVLARLERRASEQRLHASRAALLARSGVEDALARLTAGQDPSLTASRYGGEDWSGDGVENVVEPASEVFSPASFDVETCPVRHAMRPSFFRRDSLGAPDLVNAQGRLRGYSGLLGEGTYALKVEDESAKIHVNGGFLDLLDRDNDGIWDHRDPAVATVPAVPNDPGRGWNFQLARILNLLGGHPEVGVPNLGTLALQNRPAGGYRSVQALQQAVGTPRDLSPWLTVSGWTDRSVVHPNGYTSQYSYSPGDYKKSRQAPLALEEGGRPPVNLNAAPAPVLTALVQDLVGNSFQDDYWKASGYAIPAAMASGIVARMTAARPFADWRDFAAFCDGLVPGTINGLNTKQKGGGNLCGADLLKANFDPNTRLSKELPDQLLWKWVDKSDLSTWSTEGSLGPTGTFRVSAVGRILDAKGRLLAERGAAGTVEAFSLLRQTSQADFVAGRSPVSSYLSLANPAPAGGVLPQRTTGASASWNTAGGGQGLAVVSYPCAPTALPGKAASFDGFLGLATVEMRPTDIPSSAPVSARLMFLHHFDDGWNAEAVASNAANDPALQPSACGISFQPDAAESTWPAPSVQPSTFYPDGAHGQFYREAGFQAYGNFPAPSGTPPTNHGLISYWVKPMAAAARPLVDLTCIRGTGNVTQALGIGRGGWTSSDYIGGETWGIVMENTMTTGDTGYERQSHALAGPDPSRVLQPGLRWRLVTALFNTARTANDQDVHLRVLHAGGDSRGSEWYGPGASYATPYGLTSGDNLCPAGTMFRLGGWQDVEGTLYMSNQVVDELAICDSQGPDSVGDVDAWAVLRYEDGRYYKGGDGRFLSSVLDPQPGAPLRLLRAAWTEFLPRETRQELSRLAFPMSQPPATPPPLVPAQGTARTVDPLLADGPDGKPRAWIELELLDAAGTLTSAALQPLGQGGAVGRTLNGFRYRAAFRTNLQDPLSDPLLETPFLDDVTFYVQPASGPRLLAWD